ncbi:MAG: hypothetical protein GYB36_02685 [Alphaproteobacteria bacterium]|nr:hypothetical protein [Alphaproteobacteria bacterium]
MTFFDPAVSDVERAACAVAGAYLLVTFSDGQFEKTEEVQLRRGLAEKAGFTGIDADRLDAIFIEVQQAFTADYDKAAERTLDLIRVVQTHKDAHKAIIESAQTAVIADKMVTPQEENALNCIAVALGLEAGDV